MDIEELTDKTTTTEDSDIELLSDEPIDDSEFEVDLEEEDEEEEDLYDSDDEEYSELVEKYMSDNTEDGNLNYFHNLEPSKKKEYIIKIKNIHTK